MEWWNRNAVLNIAAEGCVVSRRVVSKQETIITCTARSCDSENNQEKVTCVFRGK
jgi:hypothetical protein